MEEYGCNCSFDSAGNPVDWCSFHEALRDSLAEKDKEIERLNEHLAEKDNEISDLKRGDELYRKWVEDTQKWLMR